MKPFSRRGFLAESLAGAAAAATLPVRALSSPNERVVLAFIGVRGMGLGHVRSFLGMPDAVVATVCDVDEGVRDKAAHLVRSATKREPKKVGDFRRVLDDK